MKKNEFLKAVANEIKNSVIITIDHQAFRGRPRMMVFCNLEGKKPTTDVQIFDNDNEVFCASSAIRDVFTANDIKVEVKFA